MSAEHLLLGLDAQQREAVITTAAPLAVVAAAGSGKTRVLTTRIAYRVLEGTAHARHVLALTFTRDAASEMKRRLRQLELREPIDAGTFHSIALRLLRDRALTRQQPAPQVADDRLRLMRECLTQLRLSADPFAAMADIDWARARVVEPSRFDAACRAERRRSAIPAGRYGELFDAYTALKKRRGVVDFDDLLVGLLHALTTDRSWAEAVRWRYRHFFVDEAQDMNPLQLAVLEALRNGRPDVCLVGDPRQAIYGWNGADHTTLSEVERVVPGVTVVALSTNYRCSPQVVHAAAAALAASGQHDTTQSHLDDARQVTVSEHADEHAEAEAVAIHLRQLLHRVSGRNLAVLARTNDQLTVIHEALTRHGIVTERSVGRSPLEAAIRAATRCTNREQLAQWVDQAFAGDDADAFRVAQEADRFLTSGEPGGFRAWVEARSPFDHLDTDHSDDAVSLLTFHAAKGREWWGVVVAGVEDGLVPHSSAHSKEQLHEEARLFYVALTRAGHHLHLTHATARRGRPTAPSRWLGSVDATIDRSPPVAPPVRPIPASDPLTALREWRSAVAAASGQAEHAVCPDRVLRSLLSNPPTDHADLAARLGITVSAAQRLRPLPV